jgi:hypothetical protein
MTIFNSSQSHLHFVLDITLFAREQCILCTELFMLQCGLLSTETYILWKYYRVMQTRSATILGLIFSCHGKCVASLPLHDLAVLQP